MINEVEYDNNRITQEAFDKIKRCLLVRIILSKVNLSQINTDDLLDI